VKDEIDFEFIGADLETAQTNYYFQGVTDYSNGGNASVDDTFGTFHTYEIDWTPDAITWSVDGEVKRVKKKSETFNKTDNQYHYPQTPSRVQLSLWPAGLPTNGEGTVTWAGGLVDWDHQDVKTNGYYYATFDEVSIQCYDPPPGASIKGSKSYIYTGSAGTSDTVQITDKDTILKSFLGSGTDLDADYPSASVSGSSKPTVNVIPGVKGGGAGTNGQRPAESSRGSSPTSGGPGAGSTGFSQGGGGSQGGSNGASSQNEQVLKGSLFAVLVAVVVLVTM
jgi:beta-glucanase (GH16 family)